MGPAADAKLSESLRRLPFRARPRFRRSSRNIPGRNCSSSQPPWQSPRLAKQFIILDARARKAFDESRVAWARWVDAAAWAKAFGSGKDAEAWSRRIGDLGIDARFQGRRL